MSFGDSVRARALDFRDCGLRIRHGTACCRQAAISLVYVPSRFGAEDVAKTPSTPWILRVQVTARTKLKGNHCLDEPIPPASQLPHLVSDLNRGVLPAGVFGKQDDGAAIDIRWPEYHHDRVTGNEAQLCPAGPRSVSKACLLHIGPAMRSVAVGVVWIRKGHTKTLSISRTASGTSH